MYHWGIIGTGNIARRMMTSLSHSTLGKVVAVSSLTHPEVLKEEFPELKVYDDYYKLLEDESIDIVYISTQHIDHYKWAKEAILHKKSVLCEKPMSLSYKDTKEIIELSHQNNIFLMEALKTPFVPLMEDIKKILENNEIGSIQRVETCFSYDIPYIEGKYLFDETQGGILFDCGTYTIASILYYLKNNYKDLKVNTIKNYNVDVHDKIEVIYDDAIGYMELGMDQNMPKDLKIVGDKGTLTADVFYRPTKLEVNTKENYYTIEKPYIVDDFFGELEEVHHCLESKEIESKKMSHAYSLNIAKMMEEIKNKIKE